MRTALLAIILTLCAPGFAFAQTGLLTGTPQGFAECHRQGVRGCEIENRSTTYAIESRALLQLAERVNRDVNQTIRFAHDSAQYRAQDRWAQPGTEGDCEDIALDKKRRLEDAGVPPGALRLTQGRISISNGTYINHVVLLLVTDRDTYVLDGASGPGQRPDNRLQRLSQRSDFRTMTSQDASGRWNVTSGWRVTTRSRQH